MKKHQSELLSYAKRYIELGFAIHPCCPPDHVCSSPGKIPYDPIEQKHMEGWQNHGIPTIHQVEEWIDFDSNINLGFLCGSASHIICIDIDTQEGVELYNELAGSSCSSWSFKTGNGMRLLYGMPPTLQKFASLNVRVDDKKRLEILGEGKQTVAPPSIHPNGNKYQWVDGQSPKDGDILLAPEWLLSLRPMGSADDDIDWAEEAAEGITEGSRNVDLARLAGHLLAPQPLAPKEVLFWMRTYNKVHVHPPLSDRELVAIVKSIAKREARSSGMRSSEEVAEIRRIMQQYNLNRIEAEAVWKGMG